MVNFFSISVVATVGVHKCYELVNSATFTRLKQVFATDNVRENENVNAQMLTLKMLLWEIYMCRLLEHAPKMYLVRDSAESLDTL